MHKNYTYYNTNYIISCISDDRRGSDWWMDLLTIYTHHSELQASQSQSYIATDGQSVRLGVEPHLELMTRYLLLFDT
jgi:hypothetical protein